MQFTTPYVPPTLTADLVLFAIIDNRLSVLLMKRPNDPFKGQWALPGGYVAAGETTAEALARISASKVGLDTAHDLTYFEQLYAFDTVARDPRGHAVSVTYIGCVRDAAERQWLNDACFFALDALPQLAFDHDGIILFARKRLAADVAYSTLASAFLASVFTLTELQKVHEAIIDVPLDKRNFRKKVLGLGILEDTGTTQNGRAQRPAKLYCFSSTAEH
jgi:8-oxo-dGTP diphosphatase